MSKKTFTEEDLIALRTNPNVERVSKLSIRFTETFQQEAYNSTMEGKSILDIFQNAGFNIQALGRFRIYGFRRKLLKKSEREVGFTDQRKNHRCCSVKEGKETVDQRVRRLEHELAYTRQEVEFLKKLQTANIEAQKQWESRHRQK